MAHVFIPLDGYSVDGTPRSGINVTASSVHDVLTSSHLHCTWEVTRDGQIEPCMKTAVAIRYDEDNGTVSEVCKWHACRVLVPLAFIAEVASGLSS